MHSSETNQGGGFIFGLLMDNLSSYLSHRQGRFGLADIYFLVDVFMNWLEIIKQLAGYWASTEKVCLNPALDCIKKQYRVRSNVLTAKKRITLAKTLNPGTLNVPEHLFTNEHFGTFLPFHSPHPCGEFFTMWPEFLTQSTLKANHHQNNFDQICWGHNKCTILRWWTAAAEHCIYFHVQNYIKMSNNIEWVIWQ